MCCAQYKPVLVVLFLIFIMIVFLFKGQILQTSTVFISGDVTFKWTSSNYSLYGVVVYRDGKRDSSWTRVSDTQYTVKDVMLYDFIIIYVDIRASSEYNVMTYNGWFLFFHIHFLFLFTETKMLQLLSHKWLLWNNNLPFSKTLFWRSWTYVINSFM